MTAVEALGLLAAIVVGVVDVALMVRWRRRRRSELRAVGNDLRRVHNVVKSGGPLAATDHSTAVLDVEAHLLLLPHVALTLLITVAVGVGGNGSRAGAAFRLAFAGLCVVLALVTVVVIGRYLHAARRLDVRPGRLWT